MIKILAVTLFILGIGMVWLPQEVKAQACGGRVVPQSDCERNHREWHYSCCPEGYRVQGVAYTDIRNQDHVDAISVVCRNMTKGNDVMASDFGTTPKTFVCDTQEVMAGIVSKDVHTDAGELRDTLDGLSVVCQTPDSRELRTIANSDIEGNDREGRVSTIYLPKRIVGVAFKERDNGGDNPGSSDRTDCVTIITK